MADRIELDTEALRQLQRQLRLVAKEVASSAAQIGGIRVDRESGSNVWVGVSKQLQTTNASVHGGNVEQVLRQLRRVADGFSDYADGLQAAIGTTADEIEDMEHQLAMQFQSGVGEESADAAAHGAQAAVPKTVFQMICSIMDYGTNTDQWTDAMWKKYNEFLKNAKYAESTDGWTLVSGTTVATLIGSRLIYSETNASFPKAEYSIVNLDGTQRMEKSGFLGLKLGDFQGKKKLFERDDLVHYTSVNGVEEKGEKRTPADVLTDRHFLFGGEVGGEQSWSLLSDHRTKDYGKGSVSTALDMFKWSGEASGHAGLYYKDGKPSFGADVKIGTSFSVLEGSLDGSYDVIDGVTVNGGVDVAVGRVEAGMEGAFGIVDGELQAYGGLKAEVIAAEVSGDLGVDVFGVEGKVTGKLNVGLGAHAEVGFHDGKLVFDVGAAAGIGGSIKGEIDVSGLMGTVGDAVGGLVDGVADGVDMIGKGINEIGKGINTIGKGLESVGKGFVQGISKCCW